MFSSLNMTIFFTNLPLKLTCLEYIVEQHERYKLYLYLISTFTFDLQNLKIKKFNFSGTGCLCNY